MNIYQEELNRMLPKINCKGIYDNEFNGLTIMFDGYVLGYQDINGALNYSRDSLNTDCNKKLDEVIDSLRKIREYVDKYLSAPQLPFDDVKEYRLLAEYGDTILAATKTEHGFMFCTWEQDKKRNYVTRGDYTTDYEYAKKSFVIRSDLMDKHRVYSLEEAKEMYRCISYVMDNCETLTYKQEKDFKVILEKLTWGYPELKDNPPSISDGQIQNDGPSLV